MQRTRTQTSLAVQIRSVARDTAGSNLRGIENVPTA